MNAQPLLDKSAISSALGTQDSRPQPTEHRVPATTHQRRGMSRRRFLREPVVLGGSFWTLNALGGKTSAYAGQNCLPVTGIEFDDEEVAVRKGLGILIVGASSGLGAEMARQYADHGAYVVLAARRTAKLEQVAADVTDRGGVAHVITTDVRNEAECIALIENAIQWLAAQGKVIDILALAPIRAQACAIGPDMSTEVWRNVIETNYFGPIHCLKHAVPHLKANKSTVFYFNSITASVVAPLISSYTASKHAWRGVMNSLKFENPELTVVSSYFNAVESETWHKELTCFNNDKRYCPSITKTYSIPEENMYPIPLAVEKAVRAIETQTPEAFLSLLNKAAWMTGFTRAELGLFLTSFENALGWGHVQQSESQIKQALSQPGAQGEIERLLGKLSDGTPRNELLDAAEYLRSLDPSVSLYLLALDDLLDDAVFAAVKQGHEGYLHSLADGSLQQLLLTLSSGALSPSGIADDDDGFAPVISCPVAL
jgi:NAD(P)-dependent dehydrogenase (short-subunit alcohol dehydrogenase family)